MSACTSSLLRVYHSFPWCSSNLPVWMRPWTHPGQENLRKGNSITWLYSGVFIHFGDYQPHQKAPENWCLSSSSLLIHWLSRDCYNQAFVGRLVCHLPGSVDAGLVLRAWSPHTPDQGLANCACWARTCQSDDKKVFDVFRGIWRACFPWYSFLVWEMTVWKSLKHMSGNINIQNHTCMHGQRGSGRAQKLI